MVQKLIGGFASRRFAVRVDDHVTVVRAFGLEPQLDVASTNANIPFANGIPAVTISRGGTGGGAHSLDEWWLNENEHLAIQQALLLVLAEAGLAP
ncbi:hypothetical protein SAMN00120144_3694 [Hymenobacter roseosalivarius DSM 11622]|uniref:Peptidase M20 n=1 Tax=Hymenobacter roseosalivarius DSM 11622 TaxID=645990 RepID=A0A1W1W1Z4_9BACT|nr:hypothetical protein [Hymenobacter roseosalivarius]SMB99606.1 hypothetical protein SAMN00120144_3694 [Hymenobacter roseosalivarius DSM 11622]